MVEQPISRDIVDEGMSDIPRRHMVLLIERDFKRKKTQNFLGQPANDADPTPAPGPQLGRDVQNHRNAEPPQTSGQAKIKIRGIHENGKIRTPSGRLGDQPFHDPANSRKFAENLHKTHVSQFVSGGEALETVGREAIASDTKGLKRRSHFPQLGEHVAGMEISRDLAGNDQNRTQPVLRELKPAADAMTAQTTNAPTLFATTSRNSTVRPGWRNCRASVTAPNETAPKSPPTRPERTPTKGVSAQKRRPVWIP